MEDSMPIPQEDINTNWIWVAPNETIGQIQAKLPAERQARAYTYIAFALSDTSYIVARWFEIEQLAAASGQDIRGTPIRMLQGLPKPVIGVEQNSMGLNSAREERDAQPGKRLVILSSGQPIGLLTVEVHGSDTLPPDPFASIPKRPVVLGVEESDSIPKAPQSLPPTAGDTPPPPGPVTDTRVINTWFAGVEPNTPLQ